MIVEHSFVTTLDPDHAFALAEELLTPLRFQPESSQGSRPLSQHAARSTQHAASASRSWKRGARRPGRSRGQSDIPTRVRMDYDRGRVVVAASVEAPGVDTPRLPRLLAVGVTLALERTLALGHSLTDARADCDRYHARMASRDLLRNAIVLGCIGLAVAAIIALIVYAPYR